MRSFANRATRSLRRRMAHAGMRAQLRRANRAVARSAARAAREAASAAREPAATFADAAGAPGQAPVVFFNASTRLIGLSLNAAYQLIASWAVRQAGVPVVHFYCARGMTRCVLGTERDNPAAEPPCAGCIAQSHAVHAHSPQRAFEFAADAQLDQALDGLSLARMLAFRHQDVPLGELVLPALRWVLRRHTLVDDERTRALCREFLRSAWQVAQSFTELVDAVRPRAVVVFNGMFYPEAVARWVARQRGLRVISHEVGLRPYTAFFTEGDATAYPIAIPDAFELSEAQNRRLDEYLEARMQGNFSMAGVRFWPEMRGLDEGFKRRAAQFSQVVPVFTNVVFDTSQPHSNVVFEHMFAWLDEVLALARAHTRTLFVIRAHPDEARPGKESRESVADWVRQHSADALPNVLFVPPQEYFSSYELIQRAKFVMVYNSTIGLEAALMGAPVLCAGKARYTQLPTVFFPPTREEFCRQAEAFLAAETIDVPAEFRRNARRFLYYQLYRTSLPFDAYLEDDGIWEGYVRIKELEPSAYDPRRDPILQTVVDGILHGGDFLLDG